MNAETIDLVQQYKYLGILLDGHFKFEVCDDIFDNVYTNFSYNVSTHVFNTCISPIL